MVRKQLAVALTIPRFEDVFTSFFATNIIKGVSISASRLKIDILIHITEKSSHEDWLTTPTLNPPYIDGILFSDINGDRGTLKKVIEKGIPYLVLNNYFPKDDINCMAIDNYTATIKIIDYLTDLGHRDIATICGDLNTQAGKDRLKGYQDGLKKHKIPILNEYIKRGDFLRTTAHKSAGELLSLKKRPTAIFCASDVMALETIQVARNFGLRIPYDLSIFGFDDNPLNHYSPVKLSTVSQPLSEMGRIGLETLNQIILKKIKEPVKKLLPAKLIIRDSCQKITD